MKAVLVGFVVLVVASSLSNFGLGLLLAVVASYLVSRLDALERRLKMLEPVVQAPETAGSSAVTSLPESAVASAPVAPSASAASRGEPGSSAPASPAPLALNPQLPAATVVTTSPTSTQPRIPRLSTADLEELFAGRLLAVVGGLALILGGVFFLSLAFSRGWIGPEARVILGLAVGAALYGTGGWLLLRTADRGASERGSSDRGASAERVRDIVSHVLVAVGLSVISLAFFAATRLYAFVAPELGVGAALLLATATAAIAVRARSQLIAGFGLVAVLAAPPVMGAGANLLTMAFLGAALLGTTAICLFTSWRWLPSVAFVLAAPQLASYIGTSTPDVAIGLPALAIFWGLNALSAAGEEVRQPRNRLSPSSATLLVANGAFAVWAGFALLAGNLEPWRGLFLACLGIAHLGVGAFFLRRDGDRHPFGMLTFGTGIASVTLAVPVQFGAPIVPMAWAAEAVALAWVYAERKHLFSGAAGAVLGALSIGHLLVVEYPLVAWAAPTPGAIPFANSNAAALGFMLLAAAVAILVLHVRAERVAVAGVAVTVLALAIPWELHGVPLVGAYALLTVGALLVDGRLLGIPLTVPRQDKAGPIDWTPILGDRALFAAAAIAGALGLWLALSDYLTPVAFLNGLAGSTSLPRPPFLDDRTAVAAIVTASALVVGIGVPDRIWRWIASLVAAGAIAYLVPVEAGPAWSVVVWLALGLALHALGTRWQVERRWATYGIAGAAILETLLVVASPDRLVVRSAPFTEPAVFNAGCMAAAALAAAFAFRRFLAPTDRDAQVSGALAAAWGVYLLSIGTVDLFQAQLGGSILLEELQKQAQVALSVLWAVLGVSGFIIGLARRMSVARLSGLGLLGIVTVKVFVVDLAALDVAYRVLSFVALGLLLLGAAYLSTRFGPGRKPDEAGSKR